jgi:putative flavoprotein involved in K+ transport
LDGRPDLRERRVTPEPERRDALIVGAGPAGLAVAAQLVRRGIDALILERTETVGSSWRTRYDGLRLNTDRWMARLPGLLVPQGRWPSRDDFVAYLETYSERYGVAMRFGTTVERIEHCSRDWLVQSSKGPLLARFLIITTGRDRVAELPRWPGAEGFEGELLHAVEYRSAARFADKDVLVIGIGNSGTEIATQLARSHAERVRVAMRTPPNLVPANLFGVPITLWARATERVPRWILDPFGRLIQRAFIGELSAHGLPHAPMGIATELARKGLGPVIDRGFSEALRAGEIELVAALEGFGGADVHLSDGTRIRPDVVIAATDYRFGLEELVGELGVLTPSGEPAMRDGRSHPSAPGLFFNGYWLPQTGELPAMRRGARRIARAIAREVGGSATWRKR